MPEFPFNIPKSLSVYVEQFDEDPWKVTTKLRHHLAKRGPDAVGYFLLAWFYHLEGMKHQAVEYALKAKIFAPGSPLMERLHYYLSHPDTFEAWTPPQSDSSTAKMRSGNRPEPVLDIDNLIVQLSEVESNRITPDQSSPDLAPVNMEESVDKDIDEIASETLASIHEKQGKTEAAIRTYKKLKQLNSGKSEFYHEQISRLQQLREQNAGDNSDTEESAG